MEAVHPSSAAQGGGGREATDHPAYPSTDEAMTLRRRKEKHHCLCLEEYRRVPSSILDGMRAALAALVWLLLVLPLALASNGNGVLEEARQRDALAKDHVDVSATSAHPKGEEARRGMLFNTRSYRSNSRRQDVRRIDGRSSRGVVLPPLAEGTKDSKKDARRVVVREYDADGQVVLERLEWHEEDDESMFTHGVPRRGHHAEGIQVPGQEAMPQRQTEPSNGPASNRGRRSIDQGSTPLSTCTSAMCTFAVDAAGVLSRTGGSACGDPSCGFLSLVGLSITSIAQGAFAGMVHLKMLDMSDNQLVSITHDDLKDLTALKTLALNNNLLSTIAPGTFAGLSGVEHLSLSDNKLFSISEGSFEGLSGLLSLNLDDNGGGVVWDAAGSYDYTIFLEIEDFSFRHMPLLTTLSIEQSSSCSQGGLRGIGNDTFSGGLVHLETLNLCCNCAGMDIDGIAPRAFAELPGLKTLDLRNNAIQQQDFEPGLFRHCGNLTTLSLRNNPITSLSESTFAGLAGSLESIDLSGSGIHVPLAISSISEATFEGFSKLGRIQLEGNSLSIIPDDTFANIGSSYTYVGLYGNPLICAPRNPSNVHLSLDQDSSSLPPCPSQADLCGASKCSFAVDAAGVLSRTGGSECGDPSCGFLSLVGLSITSIAEGAFAGMVHLKMLDMRDNQLVSITHDDLKDLTALKTLLLSNNLLTSIAPGTFAGLSGVELLSLSRNRLVSISEGSFEGLSGLLSLNLDDMDHAWLYSEATGHYEYSGLLEIEDFSFRHMPLLKTLSLENVELDAIGNDTFSGGLEHLETLKVVSWWAMNERGIHIAPSAFSQLPALKSLGLRYNRIRNQDLEPGLFRNCGNLTSLDLTGNSLLSLSENMFAGLAGSLESVKLYNNEISSISEATFEGFSRLIDIDLGDNRLSLIPADTFVNINDNLHVHLWSNLLICAPRTPSNGRLNYQDLSSLEQCPSQADLCTASKCSFAVDAAGVLSRTGGSECGDPSCGFLSLSGLSITSIAEGAFAGMVHLNVLDLSNNQLANITNDDLKDLTALKKLVLSNNLLTSIAPGTFVGLSGVELLSLSRNRLVSISEGSFEGLSGLLSLDMDEGRDNSWGSFLFEGGIEDFSFRHMPLLRTLSMRQTRCGVVKEIRNDTFSGGLVHLETINMGDNTLCGGSRGMRIAPRAFSQLPGLKDLNLMANNLLGHDFEPGLFRNCGNLTRLDLGFNNLETLPEGTFAGAVKGSLEWVDLYYNKLSKIPANTFKGFSKLGSINLDNNELATLPVDVFVNISSSGRTWIHLGRNPLVCAPRDTTTSSFSMDNYDLPLCASEAAPPSLPPVTSPQPAEHGGRPWTDPAVIARFSSAACQETRTMREILSTWTQDGTSTGGFNSVLMQAQDRHLVWFCWSQHPCLSSVGASQGDSMCYAFDDSEMSFHPWGLSSELGLQVCSSS